VFYVADPISSIRSERFLRFFAGAHDRARSPGAPKRSKSSAAPLIHHQIAGDAPATTEC